MLSVRAIVASLLVLPLALATASPARAAAPDVPTAVVASGADSSAVVSWTAPAGGQAPTGYTASAYETLASGTAVSACATTAPATSCTIGGLKNGTTYYVGVTAANGAESSAETARVQVVAGTVPGAPTSVTASRSTQGLTVSWQAPAGSGGTPITSYTASARTSSSLSSVPVATCTTSETSCEIAGLSSTVTYYVSVTATNAAGTGAASSMVTAEPTGTPTAPQNVTVTRGNGFGLVKWSAPASTGGSRITRYVAEAFTVPTGGDRVASCEPVSLSSLQCNIGPLPNGTTYYIQVTAYTAVADGETSKPRVAVIPAGTPEVPREVSAERVGGSVEVRWQVPVSDGGLPIEAYVASAYGAPTGGSALGTCTTTGSSCQITGLRGAAVYVDVYARTAAGRSPATTPRIRVRVIDAVDVPLAVAGSARPTGIAVSWLPPLDDGGTPISSYRASAFTTLTGGAAVSSCDLAASAPATAAGRNERIGCTIGALRPNAIYYLEVAASSEAGTTITPQRTAVRVRQARPLAPRSVSGFGAAQRIAVVWALPASDGGDPVLEYRAQGFRKKDGTTPDSTCTARADQTRTIFTCTLTDTVDFEPYWVEVSARNERGWGTPSERIWLESKPSVPSAPERVQLRPLDHGMQVSWDRPYFDGGYPIYSYVATAYNSASGGTQVGQCRVDVKASTSSTATTPTSCTITGLVEDTYVYIDVAAENTVGISAPSGRAGEAVIPGPPPPPSGVSAARQGKGVTVRWTPVTVPTGGSPVTGYRVRLFASLTSQDVIGTCTVTGSTCRITGDAATTGAYADVAAQSAAGWGPASVRAKVTSADTTARGVSGLKPADARVRALIVRYEPGREPAGTRVLGASRVTGAQRANLVLGPSLGERMWRVSFRDPVSRVTAERVARQLTSHPAVEFAEIDRRVTAVR